MNEPTATAAAPAAPKREKLRLGDVLVQQQLISPEQLTQALDQQRATGKKLGRLLIEAGLITEEALAHGLARQLRVAVVNLKSFPLKSETVRLLAESPARRHRAIVLEDKGDQLLVGFVDPLDLVAYDDLTRLLKRSIRIAVVAESQLGPALDRHYRRTEEITGLAKALEKDIGDAVDFGTLQASVGQEGAPVVRLLQSVFEDALQVGASDVHLEPMETGLAIRSRIDGVLQTQTQADKRIAAALAQRLKLMAGLDISEKRLPQDGRFTLRLRERTIDVRLSTLPCQYGESVVMRLLGHGDSVRRLDEIGMPADMLVRFKEILGRSAGMVLVTGPTGSGKTTTLYAALAELDAEQQKIITVEDPVEYRLPGLTQVQVNDKIELSFARVLRATLRQDPDVILVGEMRDPETAEIGLRAAITGHLVLSTLHTRDAASTPFRLLDMGAPPFMVASSLQAVIAQRLVRGTCENCAEPLLPTPQEAAWLESVGGAEAATMRVRRGRGCSVCNGTGYAGRIGVYEMLEMDHALAQAATHSDPGTFTKLAAEQLRGRTLVHRALELVRAGRTSVAEAMKLAT
ncbi:GspE/PulE family protein [Piscinibacter defluvii]|uniref:GspE/PulE family protein n=1 Tax=Piscinibacter defluvii TaxID=1796922 RepID=UPI000FDD2D87|nr:GspE/PulE family protein [Piscinibacter defluvii]